MKNVLFILGCLVGLQVLAQHETTLDGKTYNIHAVERNSDGRNEGMANKKLFFKNGKMGSSFSRDNKFPDAEYSISIDSTQVPVVIKFKTGTVVNDMDHTLKWEGVVKDDMIHGEAYRDRNGKSHCTYEFTGEEK